VRHRSFATEMRAVARTAARLERARKQAYAKEVADQKRVIRAQEAQNKADAKEAARLYAAARANEAAELTREVEEREQLIANTLTLALARDPKISLRDGLQHFSPRSFDTSRWTMSEPDPATYLVPKPSALARMLPGSKARYAREEERSYRRLLDDRAAYETQQTSLSHAREAFKASEEARKAAVEAHNRGIDRFEADVRAREHDAVVRYFQRVLEATFQEEVDAESAAVGYSPDSKHIVVDLELPGISVVPEESSFRWIKTGDRIEAVGRPVARRKSLYGSLINAVSLKCIDTVFRADPADVVDCMTLNGMIDAIDPANGQQVRVCLLSVRVTVETFQSLNLRQVEPIQCLRALRASISTGPSELLPVKPLVELDMVDPRFVPSADVISGLDSRTNLMDLSPAEFENLVTNLFAKMGLETRQTQASRDGGVDCVAFDSRPVLGGKVVIQAKRYKNRVGVSAVRDLYGTMQNEGASKGILVTTSGYGSASHEFAKGKPLELLDGQNLLYLLSHHAQVEAKIIMPDDWRDFTSHEEPA
jgi:restriction system protein